MSKDVKRGSFEFASEPGGIFGPCGTLEVTSGPQGVTISVTDVHAVDSYNAEFTCEAVLPRADAERMRDWLIEVLA